MKGLGKKGLSTVIATIIIVLIVMIASAIVWGVIRNIITKSSQDITISKFTIDLEIDSVKATDNNVNIKVKRNPGEGELNGITFLVFDGTNTYKFEKTGISLQPLEKKTFIIDYSGVIKRISIAPMFLGASGKYATGDIADIYYMSETGEEFQAPEDCIPDCSGKQCGDDGCGGICGECSGSTPICNNGQCSSEPCVLNLSCAVNLCLGQTCDDGCGGSVPGELEPDCDQIMCGTSPNGCGSCGECEVGAHCDGGICIPDCTPDCSGKECGDNGCGGSCGECTLIYGEDYYCTPEGICSNEACTPDCGIRNCGPVPNGCTTEGPNCGTCSDGEYCSESGICIAEQTLNSGTVYSVWPINIGIYFDSENLPKSGVDYSNYYVKFPGSLEMRCLQIREFVTPVVPTVYNMSYVRFVTSSSLIQPGEEYEIWETYQGCTS